MEYYSGGNMMEDIEKKRAAKKRYYEKNKISILQKQREEYAANPEKYCERNMRYYRKKKAERDVNPVLKKIIKTKKQTKELVEYRARIREILSRKGIIKND
tara:strand:+ start:1715 stop:2017 length:303 start_codon:yes stop_codon:yes gene_type:complete